MSQPLLTICITTYNRPKLTCDLLSRLHYDNRVEYLLVDDGSLAAHVKTIEEFIHSQGLSVVLLTKENGGKLSALSHGLKHAHGKYFTDLDSDDFMDKHHVMNMIEGITKTDDLRASGTAVVGVCGLSETPGRTVFGDSFPEELQMCSYLRMRLDYKVWGNKVEVILTGVLKKISIKFFSEEKRMSTNVLWFSLNDQPVLFMNTPFEEYSPNRPDSISSNIRNIQTGSPNGTRAYFKIIFQKKKYYKSIFPYFLAIINYQRFSWHGAKPFFEAALTFTEAFLITLSIPFGFMLYCWDIFCLKAHKK